MVGGGRSVRVNIPRLSARMTPSLGDKGVRNEYNAREGVEGMGGGKGAQGWGMQSIFGLWHKCSACTGLKLQWKAETHRASFF